MKIPLLYLKNQKNPFRRFIIILLITLSTLTFSQVLYIDLPKGIGFTREYGRIIREFKVKKNDELHDYKGSWRVIKRFSPPALNVVLPFQPPSVITLSNKMNISDKRDYGEISIDRFENETSLRRILSETEKVVFDDFPWEFENGILEIKNRDYQSFLPVYITHLGYQERIEHLFAKLKSDQSSFNIVMEEPDVEISVQEIVVLKGLPPVLKVKRNTALKDYHFVFNGQVYDRSTDIPLLDAKETGEFRVTLEATDCYNRSHSITIPPSDGKSSGSISSLRERVVHEYNVYAGEPLHLIADDDGIWNMPDKKEPGTSVLFTPRVPGKYEILFISNKDLVKYRFSVR